MPKYLILLLLPLLMLVSCGDDDSGKSPVQSEFGESSSTAELNSSSEKNSSSMVQSLSSEKSSSSVKPGESSSSLLPENKSSSSKTKSSSSEGSSSSVKPDESSSSLLPENKSSSSEKNDKSSTSEESSSSELLPYSSENSSSSETFPSLSAEGSSSSSLESTGICKTKTEDNCVYGSLYDERDGKTYKTIKIGNQEWMAENLNYVTDNIQNTSQKSYCPMSLDSCAKYGRYYTWTGAIDSISIDSLLSVKCGHGAKKCDLDTIVVHGVCPKGWHIPSISEWNELIFFVGNSKSGKLLKSFEGWSNWPGEDAFGFTVLGAGSFVNGSISDKGKKASIWVAADATQQTAKCVDFNYSELKKDEMLIQSNYKETATALPVRCIKN